MCYRHVASVILFGMLLSCKPRTQKSVAKNDDPEGPCQLIGQSEIVDPLARIASTQCNTNVEKMFVDAGCKPAARTNVAEKNSAKGARTIDLFKCPMPVPASGLGKGEVFFAHPDELLTRNEANGMLHFYKFENGNLNFKGNSFTADNPCRKCHVMGGMVMKELESPWRNWLGSNEFTEDEDRELLGEDITGQKRTVLKPVNVQVAVEEAAPLVALAYMEGIRNGMPELQNQTLRDLVKPLFCTMEVNIIADFEAFVESDVTRNMSINLANLYVSAIVHSRLRGSLPFHPGFNRDQLKAYYASNNITSENHFLFVPSDSGTQSRILLTYVKPHKNNQPALLQPGLYGASLLFDAPNPIFSKRRCGLWKHIPPTSMNQLPTAESITKAVITALSNAGTVDAKEFVGLVTELSTQDFHSVTKKLDEKALQLVKACNAPGSAIQDVEKSYRLLRSKLVPLLQEKPLKYFDRIHVVEHFPTRENSPSKMFPEYQEIIDGKYADEEGLGLDEQCELVQF
ncbi:MAG: hypothetical protein AB7T49_11400 [Oligoflexales bacterium]